MTICTKLGYPDDTREPTLTGDRLAERDRIITALTGVDTLIQQACTDGMAEKVGDLSLDFAKQVKMLLYRGSALLKELSTLAGLPIIYDKYTQTALWVPVTFDKWVVEKIGTDLLQDRWLQQYIEMNQVNNTAPGGKKRHSIRSL
jgi:hypothetical protein